jgi:hypothetical protein
MLHRVFEKKKLLFHYFQRNMQIYCKSLNIKRIKSASRQWEKHQKNSNTLLSVQYTLIDALIRQIKTLIKRIYKAEHPNNFPLTNSLVST